MKSKISKVIGVVLTVALLASLLVMAAPVSAKTLGWSTEDIPSGAGSRIITNISVTDYAASEDGDTIYAGSGTTTLYKSTNRGVTWSTITTSGDTDLVAIAPDNKDIVSYVDVATGLVDSSTNGGTTWGILGGAAPVSGIDIDDIDIAAESAGKHYVAVCGDDGSPSALVYTYDMGDASPAWTAISSAAGFLADDGGEGSSAVALEYSPNFASDQVLAVVTVSDNSSGTDSVYVELFSENSNVWNVSAGFSSYPATVVNVGEINNAYSASISLDPEYLGSDDAMRMTFVGLNLNGDATAQAKNGIHRMNDNLHKELKVGATVDIKSVAYNGATLVAGEDGSNTSYYCTDPTASSPTVSTTRSLKRPGIDGASTATIVTWADSDVVAATSTQGAFAVSHNDGKSYNDISLVGQAISDLTDVQVTPDSSIYYLLGDDGAYVSLWRYDGAWERVLSFAETSSFIARMAPDDPDVVYVAELYSNKIYYTSDGGQERWQARTCGVDIRDLAIESEGDVAYALRDSDARISKSTNSGFTWAPPKDTLLTGTGNMITTAGEGNVLVGNDAGKVNYSSDGGDTWTKITKTIGTAGDVLVTATGLADNDFIYASIENSSGIFRWQIGVNSAAWTRIHDAFTNSYTACGITMEAGALYVATANCTDSIIYRSLAPMASPTAYVDWSEMASTALFDNCPQALATSGGSAKIWAIDNTGGAETLYTYTDTLVGVSPILTGPAEGSVIPVNPIHGYAQDIIMSWEKPSDEVTNYDLWIALDQNFAERVLTVSTNTPSPSPSQPVGQYVTGATFSFMPGETYYWKVRVSSTGPIRSAWSEVRSITVAEAKVTPPVVIEPQPTPEITVTVPDIIVEVPPTVEVPAATPITPGWIYAIIAVGAILVIAVIILIVRTRRAV